jgi:flagellin-like protein
MQLKQLLTDDDAVSPVIGVILMVAITVILAAVIATFVLGLGQQVSQSAPRASFSFDYTDGTDGADHDALNITHDGGDTIRAERLTVSSTVDFADQTGSDLGSSASFDEIESSIGPASDISAGQRIDIESASTADADDFSAATVDVIWKSQEGSSSATLATFEGPDS